MSKTAQIVAIFVGSHPKLILMLGFTLSFFMGPVIWAADQTSSLLSAALNSAKQIEDESDRLDLLNLVISLQAQSGDMHAAKKTVELITDASKRISAQILLPMARAKAGDIEGAKALIEPTAPDAARAAVYQIIAQAQAAKGDINAARATAEQIKEPYFRAHADAEIALAQVRAGDLDGGLKLARSNTAVGGIRTQTYINIAIIQAKKGDQPAARKTIELANAAINEVPQSSLPAILAKLAYVETRVKDPSAGTTSQKASDRGAKSLINLHIAQAQLEMDDIKAAKATASVITSEFDKINFVAALAQAQAKGHDSAAAAKTLEDAKASLESNSNSYAIYCIAGAQARMGDANGAASWARSLKGAQARALAFCAIVEATLPSPIGKPD